MDERDFKLYLQETGVLEALGLAMTQLAKSKPPDPLTFVGECLSQVAHVFDSQFKERPRLSHKRYSK